MLMKETLVIYRELQPTTLLRQVDKYLFIYFCNLIVTIRGKFELLMSPLETPRNANRLSYTLGNSIVLFMILSTLNCLSEEKKI